MPSIMRAVETPIRRISMRRAGRRDCLCLSGPADPPPHQLSAGWQHGRDGAHRPAGGGEAAWPAPGARKPPWCRWLDRNRCGRQVSCPMVTSSVSEARPCSVAIRDFKRNAHEVRKDITPVTGLAGSPFILAAPPSFQGKSVRDVIALAKAQGRKARPSVTAVTAHSCT